ncbi:MAG TPA: hypothetical protein VFG68_22830, partial [Fimbriiglobus sp.]|nr:hypothetical protein [Fimbriiglobus sp.]
GWWKTVSFHHPTTPPPHHQHGVMSAGNTAHPRLKTAAGIRRIQMRVSIPSVILVKPEIPTGIGPDMN